MNTTVRNLCIVGFDTVQLYYNDLQYDNTCNHVNIPVTIFLPSSLLSKYLRHNILHVKNNITLPVSYGCETWSLNSKERRSMVFGNSFVENTLPWGREVDLWNFINCIYSICLSWRNNPSGLKLPIIEDSWLHSDTRHSVGLLWTNDQLIVETCTLQNTTLKRDRHPCPPTGFEPTIPTIERPQTDALDRAATRIGTALLGVVNKRVCGGKDL